jgi:hypothetical protein
MAQEGKNEIGVAIADLVPFANGDASAQIDFGIHSGFEAYGGIIRDVWMEGARHRSLKMCAWHTN